MHCSTSGYVTLITAVPHGSWMLVCCVSQRCLSTTAQCIPDVCLCLLSCRHAARSILPLHSRRSHLLTCTRKFEWEEPNIKTPSAFLGQVQSETQCGTRRGCAWAGCHGDGRAVFSAVVLLHPALLFQLGEEGRVRTFPTRARWKVGQHLAPASNKILQLTSWILKPISYTCHWHYRPAWDLQAWVGRTTTLLEI